MKNVGHYGPLNANKHFSIILRWWTKAAEQGHINAQFMVGAFHQLGFSTPYDESEARKGFERAASKGHTQAQQWLKKGILRKLHAIPLIKWVMEAPPSAPPPSYDG
jgi:TPR repeat protein